MITNEEFRAYVLTSLCTDILNHKDTAYTVYVAPFDIIAMAEQNGFKFISFENSSWEYDWYLKFKSDTHTLLATGSGYYGKTSIEFINDGV